MMSCYRLVNYTGSVMTSNSKNNLGDPQPSFDDCFVLLQVILDSQ